MAAGINNPKKWIKKHGSSLLKRDAVMPSCRWGLIPAFLSFQKNDIPLNSKWMSMERY
jgi:hypothetical protein